jgi:acyl-coenzyme A synthetase/AMP-(fatty) acid ligase
MSARTLLSHVSAIRDQLPNKRYVLNMCQDRYAFLVGFAAALCQDQTTLLPPNQAPEILQQLTGEYPDCYYLTDGQEQIAGLESLTLKVDTIPDHLSMENPQFLDTHIAAIAFTSGTTDTPRPNPKTWGSMVQIAKKTGERLALSKNDPVTIVATVPQQHMYGLETSIMLPLQHGWSVHSGRPFFPEDIASALYEQQSQRILVSTPIHLRACVMEQSRFPDVKYTLSATAPLPKHLAKQVEALLHTTIVEIYGFAEAGTIATRRPIQEDSWTLLPELTLVSHTNGYRYHSICEPTAIYSGRTP